MTKGLLNNFISHSHLSPSLRLGLDIALLLLLHEPRDTLVDTLLQRPQRLVPQHPLRLGDVVVARHAGHDDAVPGKRGGLVDDVEEDLAREAQHDAQLPAQLPIALGAALAAGGAPDGAREVPEVDGGVVGDEEDLAVDALVVQGHRRGRGGGEQELRGEEMRVRNVADVGEVEEIVVVADLDLVLAGADDADQVRHELDVALAEDACGADGGCEELVGVLTVGFDDDVFGFGLEGGCVC